MKEFLERAARADSLSPQELHVILDALPLALSWASLPDGEIKFVNRAFRTTFGYEEGEHATVDAWIESVYPRKNDRDEARRRWDELWRDPSSGIAEIEPFEIEVLCRDGTVKTIQHRGIVLHELHIGMAVFDDVSDRRAAEKALRRFAFEDPLTGLANRRMLQERWGHLLETSSGKAMTAVLLIDLDGFKAINDTIGHDAGDETLKVVAQRLRDSVRNGDLVCRMGGDEFAVLMPDIGTPETVQRICWRIGAALTLPIKLASQSVTVGASIGASLYPQDSHDLQKLLHRADEALYRRKADRKGGWEWFSNPRAA
ncbi:diguanylate cyclase [Shinella sp. AETb1-6]|uniref:Diguanylate cyclase (GGDEF)-like protein n=1 Tax=Shinella granuli TaxID=323621 RepID=A0A4R2BWG1_SHIGR|nr:MULTISPECIES: sensor domain-containing diguanylate cyclase [Shinella]MXN53177.1 diguanylate cyclase [Shinella sp. AETb1-6]TCN32207.1 diguanylate cyclase (GGDEF)-like protein [Shinella granuli]